MSPNVAELVNELHAEAHRGEAALLRRYVELLKQAAKGKLSPEAAAEAARLAYEMEMPADRFERDLVMVKQRVSLDAQIEADAADMATHPERGRAARDRIEELEQELKLARVVPHRLLAEAMLRQQRREELAKTIAEYPHLFADAANLTEQQWRALRH
jgi:hypothetical protein